MGQVICGYAEGSIILRAGEQIIKWELENTVSLGLQKQFARSLREVFFESLTPTPYEEVFFDMVKPTELQEREAYATYLDALSETEALAEILGPKLYYQGVEPQEFCMPEMLADQSRIQKAQGAVYAASIALKPGDPALERAKKYVDAVSRYYEMCQTGMITPAGKDWEMALEWAEKTFDEDRFFLKNPIVEIAQEPSSFLEKVQKVFKGSKSLTEQMPQKLRVAAVVENVTKDLLQVVQKREKLSDWKIEYFDSVEQFLNHTGRSTYDLVLTDVLIRGGGGKYLARMLRDENFTGGILAITNYPEPTETYREPVKEVGIPLKASGMDGMISIAVNPTDPSDLVLRPGRVAQKLKNYFYYQKKYGSDRR